MIRHISAVIALVGSAGWAVAAPVYVGRINLPVTDARSVAAADFDKDGAVDLAVLSGSGERFFLFFGRADGTFAYPPEEYPTNASPAQIQTGQLNALADDYPDVIVVNRAASVAGGLHGDLEIYLNNGLTPGPRLRTPACGPLYLDHCNPSDGGQPAFALVASLNADVDDLQDIVATSPLGSSLQTFYSSAPAPVMNPCGPTAPGPCPAGESPTCGFWPASCSTEKTRSTNPVMLAARIFWPDSPGSRPPDVVDLVSLNTFPDPAVIRYHFKTANDTEQFFTLFDKLYPVGDGTTTGLGARAMVAIELNADAHPDLAVANQGSHEVAVLPNIATPVFSDPIFGRAVSYPAGRSPSWVAAGRFVLDPAGTADALDDVAVTNLDTARISLLKSRGDGTLTRPSWWDAGPSPRFLSVGRFNADALDDVVIAGANAASVGLGRSVPNGGFDTAPVYTLSAPATAIAAADVDGDGLRDGIVGLTDGDVAVLLGLGAGAFEPAPFPVALGSPPTALAAGRFDDDGYDDVAVAGPAGVRLLMGAERGVLRDAGLLTPDAAVDVVAAPFDGSRIDIAASLPDSRRICMYENAGCGRFDERCATVAGSPGSMVAADLDRSNAATCPGCLDLAVLDTSAGNVTLFRRESDGRFVPGAPQSTRSLAPVALAVGQFDADGQPDLAVVHAGGELQIMLGTGTASLVVGELLTLGFDPVAVLAGPFDADPATDLAVLLGDAASAVVLSGVGDGSFRAAGRIAYGVGAKPCDLAAGAFEAGPFSSLLVAAQAGTVTYLGAARQTVFPPASAGPDRGVRPGDMPTLGAPGDPSALAYSWAPTTGLDSSSVPQPRLSASALAGDTVFTLAVRQIDTGVVQRDTVSVEFPPDPLPVVSPSAALCCVGATPPQLVAEPGFSAYSWSTGETGRCIEACPATSTTYDLTATNWAGMTGRTSVRVDVGSAPLLRATTTPLVSCERADPCGAAGSLIGTKFRADVASSIYAPSSSIAWTLPGSPAGWSVDAAAAPATDVCVLAPAGTRTATLRLEIVTPEGCAAVQTFPLEVLPAGGPATIANSLRVVKLPAGSGLRLSWSDVGGSPYTAYEVIDKIAIPTLRTPPTSIGTAAGTSFDVMPAPPRAFYQVQGNCG